MIILNIAVVLLFADMAYTQYKNGNTFLGVLCAIASVVWAIVVVSS